MGPKVSVVWPEEAFSPGPTNLSKPVDTVRLVQGQRLIPLKVAHHLLKARALVEAVRPERLHLLLRNFARRPFHAPALGPRVAQLGYLAVHGLRQPAHVVQVPLPLLRLPALA